MLRRPIKLFSPLWSKFIERLSWKSYQFSWVHKAMMLCNDNFAFRWTDDSLWWPYHVCSDSRGKKLTGFLIGTGGMSLLLQKLYYYSILYYMFYVNVWFNFFFSNSLSLQAFNNDGQEVVSTKDRPELEDRGITGMYSQLFVSHGQDSWYWTFRKILCLETMRCTTQMLHGKEMGEKLQVILKAQV